MISSFQWSRHRARFKEVMPSHFLHLRPCAAYVFFGPYEYNDRRTKKQEGARKVCPFVYSRVTDRAGAYSAAVRVT